MSERLGIRVLITLGIVILSIWAARELWDLISRFGPVLALFFCAWLISFVLSPPTNGLIRLGVPRPLAVLSVYLLVLAALVLGSLVLTPLIAVQLGQLLEAVNAYTAQTPELLTWAEQQARTWGVSESEVRDFYRGLIEQLRSITGVVLQNALGWVTGMAALLVNIIFCLIISVYMMLDGRRIVASSLLLLPPRYRGEVKSILQTISDNFGGFIRGQIILSTIYALSIAAVMWATRLEYITISAIFAGIAMIIPFVGPFVSIVPPILVAVLTTPDRAWWIILVLMVVQQFVLNAVAPRVFGHTVQMHPLLVIAAAMSGATVAGVWGALFGIPVAGIGASIVKRYYTLRQQSEASDLVAAKMATPGPAVSPDDTVPTAVEPPVAGAEASIGRRGAR